MGRYRDRNEAGRVLARLLEHLAGSVPLVLGIPRGGVVVASEVAAALGGGLGPLVAVKVRSPFNPEFAIGAVPPDGIPLLDAGTIERMGLSEQAVDAAVAEAVAEVSRRQAAYGPVPDCRDAVVVVTDDGVATGATLRAAIGHVMRQAPARAVCAIPVGPPATVAAVAAEVDEVVCPLQPPGFRAVGEFYDRFDQVTDDVVLALL